MVISYKHPTSFAIIANKVFTTTLILQFDTRKREVNRETLAMMKGTLGAIGTRSLLCHLGFDTSRTFGHHIGMSLKFGNAINKFVCWIQVFITWMAETLVPKDAFSFNTYLVDRKRLEKQVLERSGFYSCCERINNRFNTRKRIEVIWNSELQANRNNRWVQESDFLIKFL